MPRERAGGAPCQVGVGSQIWEGADLLGTCCRFSGTGQQVGRDAAPRFMTPPQPLPLFFHRLLPNVDSSCKFGVWAITSSLGWRHRESSSTCLHGGCGAESHLVCHVHPLPFLRKRVSPLPPLPALFLQPSGAESHLWACLKSNPRPSFRPLWVSGSLSLEGTHPTPGEWGRQTACAHLKT